VQKRPERSEVELLQTGDSDTPNLNSLREVASALRFFRSWPLAVKGEVQGVFGERDIGTPLHSIGIEIPSPSQLYFTGSGPSSSITGLLTVNSSCAHDVPIKTSEHKHMAIVI
jgi:hypothetical protein